MDVVRVFNNELSSLYEVKPPVSKAKMTQITKSAIKGIKFYKHIVQSVEKFIQKCRPEYKVPGLYVVDSIVRQSRHQFGADKDVFAPRFAKNINATFMNLFKCAEEDRPKLVRVLNLWQKNSVFASDVIQPLLDMANPNTANDSMPQVLAVEVTSQNAKSKSSEISSWKGWSQNEEPAEESFNYSEITKNTEQYSKPVETVQVTHSKSVTQKSSEPSSEEVKFDPKLLDFDYGDEEDEEKPKREDVLLQTSFNPLALSMAQQFLSNPEIFCQFQQVQQTIQQNEALKSELAKQPQPPPAEKDDAKERYSPELPEHISIPTTMVPFPEPPHHTNVMSYSYDSNSSLPFAGPMPPPMQQLSDPKLPLDVPFQHPILLPDEQISSQGDEDDRMTYSMPGEPPLPPQDLDERALVASAMDERVRVERSRSRSGSRTRGRSGRHRSRSRSPKRRKSRSRSRSRTRRNRSPRGRERDRQREREREREKERERRKKGIPPLKKNFISVCSTTLWLGHVPKALSEIDISSVFGEYGTILSIDMIPPRGCAYVVMDRRQDANKALQKLKNLKLQGSSIKIAWAPGKGVKGKEFKEYWEVEAGVSYIPYEKVPQNDVSTLDMLEEGGSIDEDSLPPALKELRQLSLKSAGNMAEKENADKVPPEVLMPQMTSNPPPMLPNTTMGMPMVIPQMMQQQFGMPMPGMLPPQSMVVQMPPSQLMMVQPPAQTLLAGTPLPVGSIPQMPHLQLPHPTALNSVMDMGKDISIANLNAGDATPIEDDGTSVSSPSVTSALETLAASIPASTFAMGHPGMSRPLLPVMPPVSSAGTPIPFPPPHVPGFAFPPPPLRPGVPNQNMQRVIPVPNSFPWIHKTSGAPVFGAYSDNDMRFASPASAAPLNIRMSLPNQNLHPSNAAPALLEIPRPPSANKEVGNKIPPSGQTETSPSGDLSKKFSNRHSAHPENFPHHGANSPQSYNDEHDMVIDDQDDAIPPEFAREAPRFPGPPDFQMARGMMRAPWMQGPAHRFPRHPSSPYPPRSGVPMHSRVDMEYFQHQGPLVPRMHMPAGPHGQSMSWGGNGFQPRNQERFPNRRDFYENNRFQEDDREMRFHQQRDDRGPRRDNRDDFDRKIDDDRRFSESRPDDRDRKIDNDRRFSESRSDDRDRNSKLEDKKFNDRDRNPKIEDKKLNDRDKNLKLEDKKSIDKDQNLKVDNKTPEGGAKFDDKRPDEKNKSIVPNVQTKSSESKVSQPPVKPPPPKKKVDMSFDLFRLQSYGKLTKPVVKANLARFKKDGPSKDTDSNQSSSNCGIKPPAKEKEEISNKEPAKEITDVSVEPCDSDAKADISNNAESQEDKSKRERADRKRSRWGRTHSEEREFQQQKINEIEMKFQSLENLHQSNSSVNGGAPAEPAGVDPCSANVNHSGEIPTLVENPDVERNFDSTNKDHSISHSTHSISTKPEIEYIQDSSSEINSNASKVTDTVITELTTQS